VIEFAKIRKMSDRELDDALKQAKQDLWAARFALSTRQLANTSTIPQHRKTIARIMTVQRERQEAGATASATSPSSAAPRARTSSARPSSGRTSSRRTSSGRAATATAEPAKRTKR
jgi:large subunit ribosomal protein L29